jgi:cytochrome c oxidase subunit 2
MRREGLARLTLGLLLAGAAALPLAVYGLARRDVVEVHGRMAEAGGWTPAALTATVGQPLRLRLVSDEVVHGFAVGQTDWPAIDLLPGRPVETALTFDQPGKYVFYCTRWCGLGHWRMRGTIEVAAAEAVDPARTSEAAPPEPPLYVQLGLDIDAQHAAPAGVLPERRPSATRGAALAGPIPPELHARDYLRAHSPAEVWQALRAEPATQALTDAEAWDVLAFAWQSQVTPGALVEGERLYAANCAACHGEAGDGDGVMAAALETGDPAAQTAFGHATTAPTDFTDPAHMLSVSPARLQGKIIRGGMGTGMPAWGAIFTEAQTWALVDYLWTFQFDLEE